MEQLDSPKPTAEDIAQKALGMRVSIDGCVGVLHDTIEKYRSNLERLAADREEKRLGYSLDDDSVTDEDIERANEFEGALGTDVEDQLETMFGGQEEQLDSLRSATDGIELGKVNVPGIMKVVDDPEGAKAGIEQIIDIAIKQAAVQSGLDDLYTDGDTLLSAMRLVYTRLGLTNL